MPPLIGEVPKPRVGTQRRIVVDFDAGRVEFEGCFAGRGLAWKNPAHHNCSFDQILAVHDYVTWTLRLEDGARSSAIITADGTGYVDEHFSNYDEIRAALKHVCRDRFDRGSWYRNPNIAEPVLIAIAMVLFFAILAVALKV